MQLDRCLPQQAPVAISAKSEVWLLNGKVVNTFTYFEIQIFLLRL